MAAGARVGNPPLSPSPQQEAAFGSGANGLAKLANLAMLYYNIRMSDRHSHHHHDDHHHHHPGHAHPPATVHPSILRLSAMERIAASAVVIALIWAATFWAMR
jgi:hypothetical protein